MFSSDAMFEASSVYLSELLMYKLNVFPVGVDLGRSKL